MTASRRAPLRHSLRNAVFDVDSLDRDKSDEGEWLSFASVEKGKAAADLVPDIVRSALDALPIPRRMRWGDRDDEFVRPVHWLVMLHGGKVIPGSVLGVESGRKTEGHRFHVNKAMSIKTPGEYASRLEEKG